MQLGRLAGVPITLDATFLLAAISILLDVMRRQLPALLDHAIVFVILLAGLFLSILIHELGHALVGRRYGLHAEEIRIGGFYGLASLSGLPARRNDSIAILLAGPLTNGAIFIVLWILLGMPELTDRFYLSDPMYATPWLAMPALEISVRWLAYLNIALLIFNLLPAFPLDGGRIAHLLLERHLGLWRSTRIVASLGIFIGIWSCLGIAAYPTFIMVGPFLVLINYAIRNGYLAAPE